MRGKGGAASGENREWGCEGVLELYHVELEVSYYQSSISTPAYNKHSEWAVTVS